MGRTKPGRGGPKLRTPNFVLRTPEGADQELEGRTKTRKLRGRGGPKGADQRSGGGADQESGGLDFGSLNLSGGRTKMGRGGPKCLSIGGGGGRTKILVRPEIFGGGGRTKNLQNFYKHE